VDAVMHHADADPVLFDAALNAGARGVVLVGTGAGNATPEFTTAVRRAVDAGVLVAVSTRVPGGRVTPIYTGGGAVDLEAAGAVLTGTLRAGQARIAVLAALLASDDARGRAQVLRRICDTSGEPTAAVA
jgi:L-asparaginase